MDFATLSRTRRRPRLTACATTCLLAAALLPVAARAQKPTDYDIKAAYLFNFGKFLRQPESPENAQRKTFDICVLGRDDFGGTLKKLTANEQMNGLPERVVKIPNTTAAKTCAILFISISESERIAQDMTDLAGSPVLTVSDMPHFLDHGGMIAFQMQDSHVRFSVGLDAVTKAGLTLSSELLRVSLQVTGQPKRGGL
jgi:hypothetical protein